MSKNILGIFVIVTMLLFTTACGNKNESVEQKASEQEKVEESDMSKAQDTTTEATDEEVMAETASEITRIKGVWRSQVIDVKTGDKTPGIKDFALAFCEKYVKYSPNEALKNYIKQPKAYNPEKNGGCAINDEERNGFISSHAMYQYNLNTDCCYWKCDNGHRLVAFWLEEEFENEAAERLAMFYDYDPTTGVMTPKPEWTDMIDNAVKSYDSYMVRLPAEGKDIELTKFTNAEDDSYESTEQLMKWNGNGFTLGK